MYNNSLTFYIQNIMEYSQDEQYRRAEIIIDAVCTVGKCTYVDFMYKKKSLHMNILRGVACYLSWEYGVHARRMAIMTNRTRGNIINQSKRYRDYITNNDPVTIEIYNKAKEFIGQKI